MKWHTLFLILLVSLLASACIGESQEVSNAKAEYVRAEAAQIAAETRLIEVQAAAVEAQNESNGALLAQRLELERLSWEAAEVRRANSEKNLAQTLRVLAYAIVATVALVSLILATRSAYPVWAENRIKLLEASEKQAQAQARAMEEERAVHEAKARAYEAQHALLRIGRERRKTGQTLSSRIKANGGSNHRQLPVAQIKER